MNPVYSFCHHTAAALARAAFDFRVIHPERLLTEGPVLICPNHSSYFDPPLAGIAWQGVHYLGRHTLYSNPVARWLFPRLQVVPIDQDRAGFAGLKTIIRLLKEGKRVMLFPEGARTLDGALQRGEPGAGLVVSKARAPVQPLRLFGAWEALPPGSGAVKLRKITLVVGEPLRFDREVLLEGKEGYQAISDRIMAAIAALHCPPDRIPEPR